MPTAAAKTETAIVVTKDELIEIAEWEKKFAKAKRDQDSAEREVKFRRLILAQKVLGVKSEDELKTLSPAEVQKCFIKRLAAGAWKPERGAPDFSFLKTHVGRYPSWKDLYIDEHSESVALQITAETDPVYSYRVEVIL